MPFSGSANDFAFFFIENFPGVGIDKHFPLCFHYQDLPYFQSVGGTPVNDHFPVARGFNHASFKRKFFHCLSEEQGGLGDGVLGCLTERRFLKAAKIDSEIRAGVSNIERRARWLPHDTFFVHDFTAGRVDQLRDDRHPCLFFLQAHLKAFDPDGAISA